MQGAEPSQHGPDSQPQIGPPVVPTEAVVVGLVVPVVVSGLVPVEPPPPSSFPPPSPEPQPARTIARVHAEAGRSQRPVLEGIWRADAKAMPRSIMVHAAENSEGVGGARANVSQRGEQDARSPTRTLQDRE